MTLHELHRLFQESIGYCSTASTSANWKPLKEIGWSLSDLGPLQGAILVERLRTFGGAPFLVERHSQRFYEGAQALGITPEYPNRINSNRFDAVVHELIEQNRTLLKEVQDVGIVLLLSPGDPGWGHATDIEPTWIAHLVPIPWKRLDQWYSRGCDLAVSEIRNVPPACWSPSIKSRSRLQYYLADLKGASDRPGSIAVLLNQQDHVTETSVANLILINRKGQLVSPRKSDILQGVSLDVASQLATSLGLEWSHQDITVVDLEQASEIVLVGTTACIWHASSINNRMIGNGSRGPVCQLLLERWIDLVQVDFVGEAKEQTSKLPNR